MNAMKLNQLLVMHGVRSACLLGSVAVHSPFRPELPVPLVTVIAAAAGCWERRAKGPCARRRYMSNCGCGRSLCVSKAATHRQQHAGL